MSILSIRDLHVVFDTPGGVLRAVDGVSLDVAPGETLGIVGESGCGKSVTAMSVLRLIPDPPGRIVSGSILFDGKDIRTLPLPELRKLRGSAVGMVFQDPMTSLSPLHRVAEQIEEALLLHQSLPRRETRRIALEWLGRVGIENPAQVALAWPHQLSGGMQQRVMIAIALANNPALIIADEPTTALDVTSQARVLDLIGALRKPGAALLLITHDVGVVAKMATRVAVMYAGQIVEEAPSAEFFAKPLHPYSAALLSAIPSLATRGKPLPAIPGQVPSPLNWPTGCRFAARCSRGTAECLATVPELREVASGRWVRCPFTGRGLETHNVG